MSGLYGNTFLNEGLLFSKEEIDKLKDLKKRIFNSISKFKENDKRNNKKETEKENKKYHIFTDNEIKTIEQSTKNVVKDINILISRDPQLQNTIKDSFKEYEIKSSKIPKYEVELFDNEGDQIILSVLDEDQMIRIALNSITYDIANKVKKLLNDKGLNVSVNIGDGDEGCIYVKSWIE